MANVNSPTRIGPPSIVGRATKTLAMKSYQPSSAGRYTDLPTIIFSQVLMLDCTGERQNSRVASKQVKQPIIHFGNFRFELSSERFKVSGKA